MRGRCSEDKLAASKVSAGGAKSTADLDRKGQFAIQVAVKTIAVAGAVSQQQRGRAVLPGVMTAFKHAKGWEKVARKLSASIRQIATAASGG